MEVDGAMRGEPGPATGGSSRLLGTIGATVAAGALATATMDAAMLTAAIAGGGRFDSKRLSPQIIGRWAAGLMRGRYRRVDISAEEPVPGELALGMATHYATGIMLTGAFVLASDRRNRTFARAVAYGVATSVFPLFVMFPSMGYGWAGTRSGEARRLAQTMLVGHLAFGAGIGFWAGRFGRR
jgi:hypothetical protein